MKYRFNNPESADVKSGDGAKLKDGKYHVECVDVKIRDEGEKPGVILSLECRAGTDLTQKNKTQNEFLPTFVHQTEFVQKRNEAHFALFGRILGAAPENLDDLIRAGDEVDFDWSKAIGRHCIIDVTTRTDKNDKNKKFEGQIRDNGIYAVDDPKVADVPKDMEAIQRSQAAEVF